MKKKDLQENLFVPARNKKNSDSLINPPVVSAEAQETLSFADLGLSLSAQSRFTDLVEAVMIPGDKIALQMQRYNLINPNKSIDIVRTKDGDSSVIKAKWSVENGELYISIPDVSPQTKRTLVKFLFFCYSKIYIHCLNRETGTLVKDYFTFSLADPTIERMFTSTKSARQRLLALKDTLTSIKMGYDLKNGKAASLYNIFRNFSISGKQAAIMVEPHLDWASFLEYWILFPDYVYELTSNGFFLAVSIFKQIRRNLSHVNGNSGFVNIPVTSVMRYLNLPDLEGNKDPKHTIKTPILEAVKDIMDHQKQQEGRQPQRLKIDYFSNASDSALSLEETERMKTRDFINLCYLKVSIGGSWQEAFSQVHLGMLETRNSAFLEAQKKRKSSKKAQKGREISATAESSSDSGTE